MNTKILLITSLCLLSLNVDAGAYKCIDNKGNTSYQTSPCTANQKEDNSTSNAELKKQLDHYDDPNVQQRLIDEAKIVNDRIDESNARDAISNARFGHNRMPTRSQNNEQDNSAAAIRKKITREIAASEDQMRYEMQRMEMQSRQHERMQELINIR